MASLRALPKYADLQGFSDGHGQLFISLNTVKSHTRELYRKLGATSQADAVARADALGLLEHSESPG
jgi:ATP/maltotriose-dependent transcriptional regulator MalT